MSPRRDPVAGRTLLGVPLTVHAALDDVINELHNVRQACDDLEAAIKTTQELDKATGGPAQPGTELEASATGTPVNRDGDAVADQPLRA